jgi:hypothetical protein
MTQSPPREPRKCGECGAYEHVPHYCQNCGWEWPRATLPAPASPAEPTDWVLAMAGALGSDCGLHVPIVPSVEAFRKLFAEVRAQAAPAAPAERWQALCNLWMASTILTLTQDEDGRWSIEQTEPVESIVFATLTGDDPDAAIDAARSAARKGDV